jgi:mannosyltransferase OCH1-like enzyme
MNVPRIIHQIWFQGYENMDSNLKKNHVECKTINNTFQIKFWDEGKIEKLIKKYPERYKVYKSLKYMISKIDYAREMILYHYGGIMMDMDVICIKNVEDLLEKFKEYNLILSKTRLMGIANSFHATIPKNIFIKKYIDYIDNKILWANRTIYEKNKTIFVLYTTGPNILTEFYKKYKKVYDVSNIKLLDYHYVEPAQIINYQNEDTYINHYHSRTWAPDLFNTSFNYMCYCLNNLPDSVKYFIMQ